MSSVNYSLNYRGVRLIDAQDAWVKCKNGSMKLNPEYRFVGRLDMTMPNMIVTATDRKKSAYRGDVSTLCRKAKEQIIDHFYNDRGKRNRKTVAYFAVPKVPSKPKGPIAGRGKSSAKKKKSSKR